MGKVLLGKCEKLSLDSQPAVAWMPVTPELEGRARKILGAPLVAGLTEVGSSKF